MPCADLLGRPSVWGSRSPLRQEEMFSHQSRSRGFAPGTQGRCGTSPSPPAARYAVEALVRRRKCTAGIFHANPCQVYCFWTPAQVDSASSNHAHFLPLLYNKQPWSQFGIFFFFSFLPTGAPQDAIGKQAHPGSRFCQSTQTCERGTMALLLGSRITASPNAF